MENNAYGLWHIFCNRVSVGRMCMNIDYCLIAENLKNLVGLGSEYSKGLNNYLIDNLDQDTRLSSIEFDVNKIKEGVLQGICTFKIEGCGFAAVSRASNLDDLTNELLRKIIIQLPNKYEFTNLAPNFKQFYL